MFYFLLGSFAVVRPWTECPAQSAAGQQSHVPTVLPVWKQAASLQPSRYVKLIIALFGCSMLEKRVIFVKMAETA